MQKQNTPSPQKYSFFRSTTFRLLVIGMLALVLLIPLFYVRLLIDERIALQHNVVDEISQKWSGPITLYGPVLKIPYSTWQEEERTDAKTKKVTKVRTKVTRLIFFYPDELHYDAKPEPKYLHRNNYETVVYTSNIQTKGVFKLIDFKSLEIPQKDVLWEKISVLLPTTNLKGVKNRIQINLNGSPFEFETTSVDYLTGNRRNKVLETDPIFGKSVAKKVDLNFSYEMQYKGSRNLSFIPIGKETKVQMSSDWPDPKFTGAYLPNDENKEISESGFKADWSILHFNRPFAQHSFNRLPDRSEYAFGVEFVLAVDEYHKSERSAKYGFLFIGITFLIFFLIQTRSGQYIHPFQYLMIGLALVLFYVLLLSIAEHSSFQKAYVIAALAEIILISTYSLTLFKKKKNSLLIFGFMLAYYAFIYVVIQEGQYTLLFGSIGMFVILAVMMFASSKIDWKNEHKMTD